jgi:hypothetical protein
MKVNWLDGQHTNGHFVLEITYTNGSSAYLKSLDEERIFHFWKLARQIPEVVTITIYQPDQWAKMAA